MEIKLVDLNSELWETFCGAYGNVSKEVEILMGEPITEPQEKLRRLDSEEKEDYRIAFDNLCENLSHQMSFYEATYLALPYLVQLLERNSKSGSFEWKLTMISELGLCLATDFPEAKEVIIPAESVIGKWDGSSYEDTWLWLSTMLDQLGAEEELEILSYYYGTYTCPDCGNQKKVMDFMKGYYFEG